MHVGDKDYLVAIATGSDVTAQLLTVLTLLGWIQMFSK